MKLWPVAFLLFVVLQLKAQEINIIPKPASLQTQKGSFTITPATTLSYIDEGDKQAADFLNTYLQKFYGFQLKRSKQPTTNFIRFSTKKFIKAPDNEGHYSLTVTTKNVVADGDSYAGTFYAMQSLIQLLPLKKSKVLSLPNLVIDDQPRFTYRGMHLDVSRHFFDVDYVKKYIDFIALHKMNYFHWHLTDDQGWRLEIKKYPKLTEVGAWRAGTIIGRYPGTGNDSIKYGGYYTQQQVRDIVQYAAERHITIVPEIDVPGHSLAAITAYPFLSTTPNVPKKVGETWGLTDINNVLIPSDSTFNFLNDVLSEVMELFPSKYIHIGGDECNKRWWKESAFCQELMKKESIKNEYELQSYFINRIEKFINSNGRLMMGWDEILEGGLAPNALVMSWRGEKGGIEAAKQKHQVVMTPGTYCYFDHSQTKNEDSITIGSYLPVAKVYSYNPVPTALTADEAKYILGAQGNVWTEYIGNTTKLEYMIFPRMSALSEALWTEPANKDWKDFEQRLQPLFSRYSFWGVNSSKAYYDIISEILPTANYSGIRWKLKSKFKNSGLRSYIHDEYYSKVESKKDSLNLILSHSGTYEVQLDRTFPDGPGFGYIATVSELKQTFSFNLATGKKITLTNPPSVTYPGNGGTFGLVNGVASEKGINSPEWLGFNGKDMEAIIDLGKAETIDTVTVGVLQSESSWVYLPSSVEVFTSQDGKEFSPVKNPVFQNVALKNRNKFSITFTP